DGRHPPQLRGEKQELVGAVLPLGPEGDAAEAREVGWGHRLRAGEEDHSRPGKAEPGLDLAGDGERTLALRAAGDDFMLHHRLAAGELVGRIRPRAKRGSELAIIEIADL